MPLWNISDRFKASIVGFFSSFFSRQHTEKLGNLNQFELLHNKKYEKFSLRSRIFGKYMKQFHTSVGNMLIYLNVQIIFDDIRNKLFPAGETLQFLLSLKHIFKIWPQKKEVMTLWENYTVMPPMRINCYAGLWHLVLKKGRKFRCKKSLSWKKNQFYPFTLCNMQF